MITSSFLGRHSLLFAAMSLSLALLLSTNVRADDAMAGERSGLPSEAVIGNWAGSQPVGPGLRAIRFCAESLEIGARRYRLTYGMPRGCHLDAEYSGMKDGAHIFSIAASSGGKCDALLDGFIALQQAGKDDIDVVVMDGKGARVSEKGHNLGRVKSNSGASTACVSKGL